ncbi:MAG: hypothetical protein ACM3JP_02340 [Betaproteobacteria bacterium]
MVAVLGLPGSQVDARARPSAVPTAPTPAAAALRFAGSKVFDVRHLPQLGRPTGQQNRDSRPERDAPRSHLLGRQTPAPIGSGVGSGSLAPAPSTTTSFEGLYYSQACTGGQCGAGHPPDPNGDVGPTYYIETINTAIGIFTKADGSLIAGFTFDNFMSQGAFGNLCDTDNFGDPVVLYDSFRDRWVITDFAFQLDASGNVLNPPGSYQCFAVSKSGDPVAGGWSYYSLHITDALQDYPKFGVWPDGLYMSANMFGFAASSSFINVRVWALDLVGMEAGTAAPKAVAFNAPNRTGPCEVFTLLPSNARAQAGIPPTGRPNYFASVWCYTSRVRVWAFHVDWANTANSTFTGPTDASTASAWALPPSVVPSKNGNNLDTLPLRLMAQNQYTNLGGSESIWTSHTVQGSSSSQAAVRWYQVPVTGGTIGSALQAATWNPDTANRFMPSLAVDRLGDLAIGYSVSSSTLFPAIRYAGRLAGDGAGTFSQTEQSLIEGGGSQTGNCGGSACERWGDYTAMTLDPDGCTFWYVNEYYPSSGLDHHTRIGAFRYASCAPLTPSSHVADLDAAARPAGLLGWRAVVTIRIRDVVGLPVAFATVSGSWSGGASSASSCTTDETGDCFVGSPVVPNAAGSVTFSVTGVDQATLAYDATQNADPDGDSNGTAISITKP